MNSEKRAPALKRLLTLLATVGPGLFLIGYNIGTGSVVTMAKAGAEHGMILFWAVALSCLFTFVLMVAYGRMTIVTGQTALRSFRTHIQAKGLGTILAIYVIAALVLGELLALIGIAGIVTELLQEGTRYIIGGEGIPLAWISIALGAGLFALFWTGAYKLFERVFIFFVILMGLCFILVFILVKPNLGVIAQGLIPQMPNTPGAMALVAAMAGTTCSAAVFIMRSTVVAEKGWSVKDIPTERRDSAVSASMMLFLSGIIMAVSAGTLHVMGLRLDNTLDLVHLFEPIGGVAASLLLILGVSAAGISTIFPIVLIAPWLIADFTGRPRDIRSPLFRILGIGGIALSFVSLFIAARPPAVMIFSQAFQALILPAVVLPAIYLINRRDVMGDNTASPILNVGLFCTLIFSLITSYFAIAEVLF